MTRRPRLESHTPRPAGRSSRPGRLPFPSIRRGTARGVASLRISNVRPAPLIATRRGRSPRRGLYFPSLKVAGGRALDQNLVTAPRAIRGSTPARKHVQHPWRGKLHERGAGPTARTPCADLHAPRGARQLWQTPRPKLPVNTHLELDKPSRRSPVDLQKSPPTFPDLREPCGGRPRRISRTAPY